MVSSIYWYGMYIRHKVRGHILLPWEWSKIYIYIYIYIYSIYQRTAQCQFLNIVNWIHFCDRKDEKHLRSYLVYMLETYLHAFYGSDTISLLIQCNLFTQVFVDLDWNAFQRVCVKYILNMHMHNAIYHRGYSISVANFTKTHCHLITDVRYYGAASIGTFTLVGACDNSVFVCGNNCFTPSRVPAIRNDSHGNTPNWAAVQPYARQGNLECPLFGTLKMNVYNQGWVTTDRVQWHAPGKISRGYMKVR